MPKKKKKSKQNTNAPSRPLPIAEIGQSYALVEKSLGDRRMMLKCVDGAERIGRIRGAIRKRRSTWISPGQYVLIALRDFQDNKCDIIEILTDIEVKRLIGMGEIFLPKEETEETFELVDDEEETGGKIPEISFDDI